MARLHHVSARIVAEQSPAHGPRTAGPTWKPAMPGPRTAVEPWFSLSPHSAAVDNRVGNGGDLGVAATLETFGSVTGPSTVGSGGEALPAVLGGLAVAPATPAPRGVGEFVRSSHARIAIEAEGLSSGQQCLVLVALHVLAPTAGAALQTFVGTAFIGEDAVAGEDRIALLLDAPEHGRLDVDIRHRLVGGSDARIAVVGAQGYLL